MAGNPSYQRLRRGPQMTPAEVDAWLDYVNPLRQDGTRKQTWQKIIDELKKNNARDPGNAVQVANRAIVIDELKKRVIAKGILSGWLAGLPGFRGQSVHSKPPAEMAHIFDDLPYDAWLKVAQSLGVPEGKTATEAFQGLHPRREGGRKTRTRRVRPRMIRTRKKIVYRK